MTQKTVLNQWHLQSAARMVDFGGWEMPLHYGSQIEEHHAVRRDCGMFDVSHMGIVDVTGPQARLFLSRLLANSVDKLKVKGKALYSLMLNEHGGVIDDLIVYYIDHEHFRMVINANTVKRDLEWLETRLVEWSLSAFFSLRQDLAMIAVQGPNASRKVRQVLPQSGCDTMTHFFGFPIDDFFIARTGYTGEDGFEISLPAENAVSLWQLLRDAGVMPCGLGARDTLRLESGMCLYGQEMDETVSPFDAGLAWTVDLNKDRDFVGKQALLARDAQWQLSGLLLSDKGVLRAGQKVVTSHGDGAITSGTYSPTMQQAIALARLPLNISLGNIVQVEIRGIRHAAKVVKPPFVRNGKILV